MQNSARSGASARPGPIRILIVDDHDLARAGLRSMLSGATGLEVIGEAENGRRALEQCAALQPTLVLMDVRMPDMDGLAATAAIKRAHPRISVLVLTAYGTPEYLLSALRAGASGYMLKDIKRDELIGAIQQVVRGETFLNSQLAVSALQMLGEEGGRAGGVPPEQLTPRELEVLRLLAQGRTNREIAERLVISAGTVKVHVEHIIAKLGVSDRTQAAVRAIELGLIQMQSL